MTIVSWARATLVVNDFRNDHAEHEHPSAHTKKGEWDERSSMGTRRSITHHHGEKGQRQQERAAHIQHNQQTAVAPVIHEPAHLTARQGLFYWAAGILAIAALYP